MGFKIYVRAIVKNSQGKILLIQKQPNQKIAGGKWLLPGGAVEFGETPILAMARELKEESNLILKDQELLGTETIIIDDTHWLGIYYQVFCDTDTVKNLEPDKHLAIEWCSFEFSKANLSLDACRALDVANIRGILQ